MDTHHHPARRARLRLVVLTALAVALVAAACGSGDDDDTAGGAGAGSGGDKGWSYVDGSGKETELDETPTKIVMHAYAAAALIPLGIEPVAIYADTTIEDERALQGLDLDGVQIVGEEWGTINVEKVAALQPDLIISEWWPLEKAYSGLEEGVGASSLKLKEIAPIVGVAQAKSIEGMIEDYVDLAGTLGADVDGPAVARERDRFTAAKAAFEEAVKAKPGLSVLAVAPTPDNLAVANPGYNAELLDFIAWGMDVIVPDAPDDGFEYWESLSWENADKYQPDLLIVDQRTYPEAVEEAERTQPSWKFLKAAAADAVAEWPAWYLRNYSAYADALDALTTAVQGADPNLVA
jgi:iron complex transport system substrate-binding protein